MQAPEQPGAAPADTRPILVLGLGNLLLRDEGVGVHVVRALDAGPPLPPDVEVLDGATAGFGLIDILSGRRKVIVIDAIEATCAPGSVVRLTIDDLVPTSSTPLSLHEVGFLEALAATARLGVAPQDIVIFGVRPAVVDYGLELSPTVAALLPRIVQLVLRELRIASDR